MLKFRLIIFSILVCCVHGQSHAQTHEEYFKQNLPVPFQKIYLHIDRDILFTKDTVWFAAYSLDGSSHLLSEQTCNLYVDLVDDLGDVVRTDVFVLRQGIGAGYLPIADSLHEGHYLVRAYTDYLLNFDSDTYFERKIRVAKLRKEDSSDAAEPTREDIVNLSFMPEGGFMLANTTNCVAFKATDHQGRPVDVSGKIMDKSGNEVQKFKSVYRGLGKFYLFGQADNNFVAVLDEFGGRYPLPDLRNKGYKLKAIKQDSLSLDLAVQEHQPVAESTLFLAALHRGRGLFFVELDGAKRKSVLKLPIANFGSGINRVVLLDQDLRPLSERLFFNSNGILSEVIVKTSKPTFGKRRKVSINISKKLPLEESTSLSVAVVSNQFLQTDADNMVSYLMLNSEIKGRIDHLPDFLIDGEIPKQVKLDLLMMTHGWSNYIWPTLERDDGKLLFKPDLGFSIKGQTPKSSNRKHIEKGNVSLIIYEKDKKPQFLNQPFDKDGHFTFPNVIFSDWATMVLQAQNKNQKNNLPIEVDFAKRIAPKVDERDLRFLARSSQISSNLYEQRLQDEIELSAFDPSFTTVYLEGVEVTGRKIEKTGKKGLPRANDGAFQIEPKSTSGLQNIIQYLQFRVPGVTGTPSGSISLIGGAALGGGINSEPLIYIDGNARLSVDEARQYPLEIFETIEVLTPPASNFYRAPAGAVLLTTKSGRSLQGQNQPFINGIVERIQGFAPYREFYSPNYEGAKRQDERPDIRRTLYWSPQIIVKDQPAELSFFTGDHEGLYYIIVEGISQSGHIHVGKAAFSVSGK